LRELNEFGEARAAIEMTLSDVEKNLWVYKNVEVGTNRESHRDYLLPLALVNPIVEKKTGEVIAEAGARLVATDADADRENARAAEGESYVSLSHLHERLGGSHVVRLKSPC